MFTDQTMQYMCTNLDIHFHNDHNEGFTTFGFLAEEKEKCIQDIIKKSDKKVLIEFLSGTNGSYTILNQNKSGLNVPVINGPAGGGMQTFYNIENGIISNDFSYILKQMNDKSSTIALISELLCSGYVFGRDMPHPKIKKLLPGEILVNRKSKLAPSRYHSIDQNKEYISDKEILITEYDKIFNNIFRDLKVTHNSRPIILPLSGGYDSRLLALMLYKHDFDNVYSFTDNTQSSYDIPRSELISNKLGFEWEEFNIQREDIRRIYKSSVREEVKNMSGNYPSHHPKPHSSLRVKYVSDSDRFPNKGLFLGGLNPADGVSIPKPFLKKEYISKDLIANHIINNNTGMLDDLPEESYNILYKKFVDDIDNGDQVRRETADSELLSHYYIKSANVGQYLFADFLGYDHVNILRDKRWYGLYNRTPIKFKYNRKIFEEYVERLNDNILPDVPIGKEKSSKLKSIIVESPIESQARSLKKLIDNISTSDKSDDGAYDKNIEYGYMTRDEFEQEYTGKEHYNYFLVVEGIQNSDLEVENILNSNKSLYTNHS